MFRIGNQRLNTKTIMPTKKTEADLVTDARVRELRERLLRLAKEQDDKHSQSQDASPELPT